MYRVAMTTSELIFGCAIAAVLAALPGCGGKVVIDENEMGQGGASTTTGSTSGSTISTSSTTSGSMSGSTGSGGSDIKTACSNVCNVLQMLSCTDPNCAEDCVNTFSQAGDCADEFVTLVNCYNNHLGEIVNCDAPVPCSKAQDAFVSCQESGGCSDQTCSQDNGGSCSCLVTCGGTKLSMDCSPSAKH